MRCVKKGRECEIMRKRDLIMRKTIIKENFNGFVNPTNCRFQFLGIKLSD